MKKKVCKKRQFKLQNVRFAKHSTYLKTNFHVHVDSVGIHTLG